MNPQEITFSILQVIIGIITVLFGAIQCVIAKRNKPTEKDSTDLTAKESQNTDEVENSPIHLDESEKYSQPTDNNEDSYKK